MIQQRNMRKIGKKIKKYSRTNVVISVAHNAATKHIARTNKSQKNVLVSKTKQIQIGICASHIAVDISHNN